MKAGRFLFLEWYGGCGPKHINSVDVYLPLGWRLSFDFGFGCFCARYKVLANGDFVPYSEVIAPDDWRNQPLRRNGQPW